MDDSTITNGLKRRNSVPSEVIIPRRLKSSPPSDGTRKYSLDTTLPIVDFELVSLKFPASYTSLKDIIPCGTGTSSLLSPAPAANSAVTGAGMLSPTSGSGYEISIRNRLVKQAAWAYLQPTVPSSPSSSSRCFWFSGDLFGPIIARFRQFSSETATRVYDWLVDVLWLILCR